MGFFESETFILYILKVAKALCGLFCAPVYDEVEITVEAVLNSKTMEPNARELKQLYNSIQGMSGEGIAEWLKEAKETMHRIDEYWQQQRKDGSSNHNNDHQSSCFCMNACSSCNLHRKTKKLIALGKNITRPLLEEAEVEPLSNVPTIKDGTTADRKLNEVMEALEDDDVWCIGVWGQGGVGKSTLVNLLKNKVKDKFDYVKFFELKKDDGNKEVQEAIARSLDLDMGEKVKGEISNKLQWENILLILDNLWKPIDLQSIGIPKTQKGSKVVFTTRSHQVCHKIKAKEIKMECLENEEAWELFAEKVGSEVVNDKDIKPLAQKVCEKCGNLPLALVIVGSAMNGQRHTDEWETALEKLRSSIPIDEEVKSGLYSHLKLSYDSLDDTLKSCFLYCSLYPEGYYVEMNDLIQCWIAEKLIDDQLYYDKAYNEGLSLVRKLMNLCLLEEGPDSEEEEGEPYIFNKGPVTVAMHDVVHNTARWIAKDKKKSIVFSGYGISKGPNVEFPEEANKLEWISFVENKKIVLPKEEIIFPSVTAFVSFLLDVSVEFLNGFHALRVLDMVGTKSLPYSRLQLEELRALLLRECSDINELPSAKKLVILDLSYTQICELPRGMEQLTNIKVLILSKTPYLKRIYSDTIRSLQFLEVLDMSECDYTWPTKKKSKTGEATLEDFSQLQSLREVYLLLADAEGTYEECSWMGRLKCFFLAYGDPCNRKNREKIIAINLASKVGSFIFHAEILNLRNSGDVNEVFASFFGTDQRKSKLKAVNITKSDLDTSSEAIIPEYDALSNVEQLFLNRSGMVDSFSEITVALGTSFSKLRSATIRASAIVVFSSDDVHIKLPTLERLSVHRCYARIAFYCGVAEIQAIAPNLKILELCDSPGLESVCDSESNEPWTSLEILHVEKCPDLRNIPFMPSVKEIRGSVEWWNKVEWDSEDKKSSMNQRFKPLEDMEVDRKEWYW